MQAQNGAVQGIQMSMYPLVTCHTNCKCSMEASRSVAKAKFVCNVINWRKVLSKATVTVYGQAL